MYCDDANVGCDCGQHRGEKLGGAARPERSARQVTELIGCGQKTALRKVSCDRAVGDRRSRLPQAPCIGAEIAMTLPLDAPGVCAVEKVAAANALAIQCRNDILIRTSREAMKQDGFAPQGHTQRWSTIVVSGAAAHAFASTPCTLKAFDDGAGAAFELMRIV